MKRKLLVLELFSGTQSISKQFRIQDHKTITLDNNDLFDDITDYKMNILDFDVDKFISDYGRPDVIWASPPCTTFSVASIGTHWGGGYRAYQPKTENSKNALLVVQKTIDIIKELNPKLWFIENPRGVLRKLDLMKGLPRFTVTYCQYGDSRMKPTDIWTNHPDPQFKPMCKNGDPCHTPAPRGSKTGTQGLKNAVLRSIIPEELCKHIVSLSEGYVK